MEISFTLQNMLSKVGDEIKGCETELAVMPPGHITQEVHQGKPTLVIINKDGSKRVRNSIPTDSEQAALYLRKIVLSTKLDELRHNERVLANAARRLKETTIYDYMTNLSPKFTALTQTQLLSSFTTCSEATEWENEPYEQLDYRNEYKQQVTSRGLRVRSKSELIIAEILYENHLPFRYEQVLHFDNITLAPDFTIKSKSGKVFYWEHQGLNKEREYQRRQIQKLDTYISHGITPWDNLIVSYDNEAGNIDIRMVKAEIENKLL